MYNEKVRKMIVTVSKGQQITIPANIREEFGLHSGSKVDVETENDTIVIKRVGEDLADLFKRAKSVKPKHNLTPAQMNELNERMFR